MYNKKNILLFLLLTIVFIAGCQANQEPDWKIALDCSEGIGNCEEVNITHTIKNCNEWSAWDDIENLDCTNTQQDLSQINLITDPANHVRGEFTTKNYTTQLLPYDLAGPWDFEFLPNNDILLTERSGAVKLLRNNETRLIKEIDAVGWHVQGLYNSGLLGVAVHPNFEENNKVYFYYTYEYDEEMFEEEGSKALTKNKIAQYTLQSNQLTYNQTILDEIPGSGYHTGGRLSFGPDQKLYLATGDASLPETTHEPDKLYGKILRMNPDGTVPEDNPFETHSYSVGHRNPQGIAWNQQGQLYNSEHGPKRHDEINQVKPGKDYGFNAYRCDERYRANFVRRNNEEPVYCSKQWTMAPSGMTYINNESHPWHDSFFVTLLRGKHIHRFVLEDDTVVKRDIFFVNQDIEGLSQRLRHVEYHQGNLYAIGDSEGMIKITPN